MKKIIIVGVATLFLMGCSEDVSQVPKVPEKHNICVDKEIKIETINILGKSGSDESQGVGFIAGLEVGAAGGAMVGGPAGAVIGGLVGGISGAIGGTFDSATDYEAITNEGRYVCQEKECEDLTGASFKTDGKNIIKSVCEYK